MLRPILTGLIEDVAIWYSCPCRRVTPAAAIKLIPRHTISTGITSRHLRALVGSCRKFVPSKYDSGPEVLIPSFHPENGERSELSTIDGRTIAIGSSRPLRANTDSPRLFVNVYVLGHPRCCARLIPTCTKRFRAQRNRLRFSTPSSSGAGTSVSSPPRP